MFYLFVKYLESLGDRVNPITLRDLRRLRRHYVMDILAVFFVVGTTVLFFATDLSAFDGPSTDRAMVLAVVPPYMLWLTTFLTVGWPLFSLVKARSTDELLGLVPLTPKQQVHGYLGTSVLSIGFFTLLLLPFNIAAVLIGPLPVWFLAIPPAFFLVGVFVMLYTLSFVARSKKVWELILSFFIGTYLGGLAIQIPAMATFYFLDLIFPWPPSPTDALPFWVVLLCFSAMASISYGYVGYRISVFQFGRREMAPWSGAIHAAVCYGILAVVWCVAVLAFASMYFTFFVGEIH